MERKKCVPPCCGLIRGMASREGGLIWGGGHLIYTSSLTHYVYSVDIGRPLHICTKIKKKEKEQPPHVSRHAVTCMPRLHVGQ